MFGDFEVNFVQANKLKQNLNVNSQSAHVGVGADFYEEIVGM